MGYYSPAVPLRAAGTINEGGLGFELLAVNPRYNEYMTQFHIFSVVRYTVVYSGTICEIAEPAAYATLRDVWYTLAPHNVLQYLISENTGSCTNRQHIKQTNESLSLPS